MRKLSTRELLEIALKAEDEKEQALLQLNQANETILLQAPKVEFVNQVLQSESAHTTTTIARELGMSAPTLNKILHKWGIQYYTENHWVLYHRYQNMGYTKTRTHTYYDSEGKKKTNIQTVWTEEGRMFIHKLMKEKEKDLLKAV